jgi:hypothetical protein
MLVYGSILNGQIAKKVRSPRKVIHDAQPIGLVFFPSHPKLLEKILHFRREAGEFFVRSRQLLFQLASTLRPPARHTPDEECCHGYRKPRGHDVPDQIRTHPSSLHSCKQRHAGE